MPLTLEQRRRNEASIRAAMDRLLRGQLPPHGGARCADRRAHWCNQGAALAEGA